MKTNKYIQQLIRDDFDSCEDSFIGDEKMHDIIQHAIEVNKAIKLDNGFVEELINDYCLNNANQNLRLQLLLSIQTNKN